MKNILYAFLVASLSIGMVACSSDKTSTTAGDKVEDVAVDKPLIVAQYDSLNAVVQYYWDTLTKMDDEKFSCLDRLYDEMEIMPKSNSFIITK